MAFRCSQPGLHWVHSQDAFLYQVRHVHWEVGEQFLFVRKCSPGHKPVEKANKQHPAVAYVNKRDAFANYTASQNSLLASSFSLVNWRLLAQWTFISQHSGFCYLLPDLYQHIHVRAAGGWQRRRWFHGGGLCLDTVEVQQRWTVRSEVRAQGKRQQLLDEKAETM